MSNEWPTGKVQYPTWGDTPADPRDKLTKDEILMLWQSAKEALTIAKDKEMDLRKYIVKRAFPEPKEGMNKQDLGAGYEIKATIKFNYNLEENAIVEKTLDEISKVGNEGTFIADRLVSWTPNFLKSEYTKLQQDAEAGNETAKQILKLVHKMLIITDATPTLEIKGPKEKK